MRLVCHKSYLREVTVCQEQERMVLAFESDSSRAQHIIIFVGFLGVVVSVGCRMIRASQGRPILHLNSSLIVVI